jgi:hypothetical protein
MARSVKPSAPRPAPHPPVRCIADGLLDLTAVEADILQFAIVIQAQRMDGGLPLAISKRIGDPGVDDAAQPREQDDRFFCTADEESVVVGLVTVAFLEREVEDRVQCPCYRSRVIRPSAPP